MWCCVDVFIVDDIILENDESFILTLERTPDLDSRITLDPVNGVVEITENDAAVVGLERTFYQVSEDVGVLVVCAIVYSPNNSIPCPINFAFDVNLSTSSDRLSTIDGNAVNSLEYGAGNNVFRFAACEMWCCVDVFIVDDIIRGVV
jgi:hypothetical protein